MESFIVIGYNKVASPTRLLSCGGIHPSPPIEVDVVIGVEDTEMVFALEVGGTEVNPEKEKTTRRSTSRGIEKEADLEIEKTEDTIQPEKKS